MQAELCLPGQSSGLLRIAYPDEFLTANDLTVPMSSQHASTTQLDAVIMQIGEKQMTKFGGTLAALAFALSVGTAAAQDAATGPIGPDVIKRLLPSHGTFSGPSAAPSNAALSGGGVTLNGPGNVPTGWNYFHATYCEWYFDGSNNFVVVYPQEGGYWYSYNNIYTDTTFKTACVNGNWVAVYVTNSTTGAFYYVFTYPYK
jgi:hypothetical protein